MKRNRQYKYIATSRTGFVQQVVCSYVRHGYRFHVSGKAPPGKDPREIDEKLLTKYNIARTESQRYSAKKRGEANLQYIRFERDWLMLGTAGSHEWREKECENIKDCGRGEPIYFQGYTVLLKNGLYRPVRCRLDRSKHELDNKKRVRVLIGHSTFHDLKARFVSVARRRRADYLASMFWNLPYEPYAPIRRQMLKLLFLVNQARKTHGLKPINKKVIRFRRRIVKPFETMMPSYERDVAECNPMTSSF